MANILGVNTGQKDWSTATADINAFFQDGRSHYLVTPNPEIILRAQNDEELFYILNKADLSLADGFGLKLAAGLSGQKLYRITGADLAPYLLREAEKNKWRVLLIAWNKGLSSPEDLAVFLKNYPHISPLIISSPRQAAPSQTELANIRDFRPELVLCLLGSPEQEKYIFYLYQHLTCLPLAAGLGGAFDFLTGKLKRAPKLWRRFGLEWCWRLIQQPWRWRRIWRATAVFMSEVLFWLVIMPSRYRPNVAVLMYKKTEKGREIFIVERQDRPGHWQLPQGGIDGLDLVSAGEKELKEESGAKNFKVIASYKNLYRYTFDKETGKYKNPQNKRHFGYKGQKQSLLIVEFTGTEAELRINYWDHSAWRWIAEAECLNALHPCRREAGKIYLEKLKDQDKE